MHSLLLYKDSAMAGIKYCCTFLILMATQELSEAYPPTYMRDTEWLDDLNYFERSKVNEVEGQKGALEDDLEQAADDTQEVASARIAKVNDHPDLPFNIVEMDIVSTSYRRRGYSSFFKWDTSTIPYSFHSSISAAKKVLIKRSMTEIEQASTCIKFVEDPSKTSRLNFINDRFCYANIGRLGFRATTVSIGDRCVSNSIIVHEILHGLGFFHEQSRPDRDQFVKLFLENAINGTQRQFAIHNEMVYRDTPYDYDSVMHYQKLAFSKNGKDTIQAKDNPNRVLGNRVGLSDTDILQLQKLFCPEALTTTKAATTTAVPTTTEAATTTAVPTTTEAATTTAPTTMETTTTAAPTTTKATTTTAPTTTKATTTTAPTTTEAATTAPPTTTKATTTTAPTTMKATTTTAPTTTKATTSAPTTTKATTTSAPTTTKATTTSAPTTTKATTTTAPTTTKATTTTAPTTTKATTTTAPTTTKSTIKTTASTKEATSTTASTTASTAQPTATVKSTTQEVSTSQPTSTPKTPTLADVAQCDMERGLCQWIQSADDAFNWRRGMARSIPMLYDHTSGVGYFMYAAARRRSAGEHASIYTKFIVTDGKPLCFEMFYAVSQYLEQGVENHTLILQAQIAGEENPWTLATIKADENKQWKQFLHNIDSPKGRKLRLNLTAVIGNPEYGGGIAIDDIKIYNGYCPTDTNTSSALQCAFERSVCEWQEVPESTGGAVWTRSRIRRLRPVTRFFHKYMVALPPQNKASSESGQQVKRAVLKSLSVSVNQETCLMMYSYIRNVPGASISVNSIDVESEVSTQLLLLKNDSNRFWRDNSIMLPVKKNYRVEIVANFPVNQEKAEDESADPYHTRRRRRRRRRRIMSAVAIDNIEVLNTKCPPIKDSFFCDFEIGICNMAEAPEASCPWKREAETSETNSYVLSWNRDHCAQGMYDWLAGGTSFVTSLGRRGSCLEFEYRIKTGSKCHFGVSLSPHYAKVKRHINKTWIRYVTSRNWMKAKMPLYPSRHEKINVHFHIYFQYDDCEVMQLDRIKVSSGLCPYAELPR